MTLLSGVWTALVTPFKQSGALDLDTFHRLLAQQRDAGVAGVIPCGTTGETPTLQLEEKKTLVESAVRFLKGSNVQVVAGTGTNQTQETVEFSRWAETVGVHGVLVVTPYYNKPSQAGLKAHFKAVADAVQIPVIQYNVPGRTGVSLTPETMVELARDDQLKNIKEATGNLTFASEIFSWSRKLGVPVSLLSGDDPTFLPFVSLGGRGCISVASNVLPRVLVRLWNATQAGHWEEAKEIHHRYFSFFQDLFIESNPVPVKYVLSRLGYGDASVRLPLVELLDSSKKKLDQHLQNLNLRELT